MLLSLITSLLVLLGAAAPVTEDPALSPTLAKRNTRSSSSYGYNIIPADCAEALGNMQRLPQFKADGGEGIFALSIGVFSRTGHDSRFRLPQSFTVRTCTILIELSSNLNKVVTTRSGVPGGAQSVIRQCINDRHIGGGDTRSGIETVIGSEQTLAPILRPGWEQCKLLIANNSRFDEHAQCLLHEFEVDAEAAARERAKRPENHNTSKRRYGYQRPSAVMPSR